MTRLLWLLELRAALDAEHATRPRVASLATVDEHGRPRVRSVICRRIEDDGTVWVCSDARSAKNAQLRRNPAAELALWLPGRREQFRLAGTVAILGATCDDHRRAALWSELSDESRALFIWPAPGWPREPAAAVPPLAVPADASIPESFELLLFIPEVVDHLDLNPAPHRRRCWRREAGWRDELINP